MHRPLIMKFVEIALHWRCTSVRFSIQHLHTLGRPSRAGVQVPERAPAMSVASNFPRYSGAYSGAQIHSPGWRAF